MKDSQYQMVRDYCRPIAEEWIGRLWLGWERIDLHWSDSMFSLEQDGHKPECIAFVDCQWEYMQASVVFSCARLFTYWDEATGKPEDESFIRYVIIHELCHILVSEMREYANGPFRHAIKHEERVVSRLAKAFGNTYDQGVEKGRLDAATQLPGRLGSSPAVRADRRLRADALAAVDTLSAGD